VLVITATVLVLGRLLAFGVELLLFWLEPPAELRLLLFRDFFFVGVSITPSASPMLLAFLDRFMLLPPSRTGGKYPPIPELNPLLLKPIVVALSGLPKRTRGFFM